jgi:hypothetical protein
MTLNCTILVVGYRLARDCTAAKLVDYIAVNLIGLEIHLVGWPLMD